MSTKLNNPIWVMSSAYDKLSLDDLISTSVAVGAQGVDLCVFRKDGTREDHTATHLAYEGFGGEQAKQILEKFNTAGLQLSLGAFENMIGGDPAERIKNQNHLLRLIRIASLLGGDANDVKVGTFVGYNHELGNQIDGFERNLEEYKRVFEPIVKYAESLGVTIVYENCPMEGWRSSRFSSTYNNLPAVLAARKLMYALIPSKAHGEIYDPSHDIWQNTNPVDVIEAMDIDRLKRVHVKTTRNLQTKARVDWGGMYPMQHVSADLAQKAGVDIPQHDWDRHHYEAMLPGFGGTDNMDWNAFVGALHRRGFGGPFEIENEAKNSKDTQNMHAINQGFKNCIGFLSPLLWDLDAAHGYQYKKGKELIVPTYKEVPEITIDKL
ncbi:sugar phosphate isomerase/epimerase family protein [Sphingobacterium psychroaquaticum]|uniref:Sugar phosphate isomerase/epimerase n=1 Tax=Sphingobacterium psychroaquaticum TaxID=561061 RepID=A0A1X7J0F7_9SPHI|nr:sugar phosphate isomerase/epimerase [Sphingobacterium psychroaquaticum]QBQ40225.1 sugar phosphate isomerase/epimerase [Sphingobacterium psychroaquaticum]SMG20786.1 Sugar phosphate isomerase/epimerase [Sphingobacterium psychroaquaticum]